jgi:OOP family OmpA-OmpF porin
MSSKNLIIVLLYISSSSAFGQNIFNRLKQKATEITEKVIDKKVDQQLEGKSKRKDNTEEPGSAPLNTQENIPQNTAYNFKPGNKVLFKEDFSQDATGEFPLQWHTNSKGEVIAFDDIKGKWLRLYKGVFLSPTILLNENYTLEFDVVINFPKNGVYPLPKLKIGVYDMGNKANLLSSGNSVKNNVNIALSPYNKELRVKLTSIENGSSKMITENYIHIAMDIQKERIRVWIDKERVLDLPSGVPMTGSLNQLRLEMESSNYTNKELGYYISNLSFAEGTSDMRSKLLTEGRLESSAILFATNSSKIQSDNQGIIKEVAEALKLDHTMRITVIGHTDSDGDPLSNLTLSRKRAESVKKELTEKYGIDKNSIEIEGKGDKEPVSENITPEEKAKNRRVEFVKI